MTKLNETILKSIFNLDFTYDSYQDFDQFISSYFTSSDNNRYYISIQPKNDIDFPTLENSNIVLFRSIDNDDQIIEIITL